jgi:hypothetical protein
MKVILRSIIVSCILLLSCIPAKSALYETYAAQATSNWGGNTWMSGGVPGLVFPTASNSHNAVIYAGHTKTHDASSGDVNTSGYVEVYGTLNLGKTTGTKNIGTLRVKNGGIVNITAGTYTITNSIIVEAGGIININGGTLLASATSGNSVNVYGTIKLNGGILERKAKLIIYQGGLIEVNSSSSRLTWSGFSTNYSQIDGTFDCKNYLTSANRTNFALGLINVTANTTTGRIRTMNAYTPGGDYSNITASNNFFGFNSTYGGTVEYYGTSTITLDGSNSRYYYYDLEVNTTGGLLLGYSVCTNVVGNLYLKAGNLNLNGRQINLHGTIVYSPNRYIISSSTGKLHIAGKTSSDVSPCMNYFSSITTDLPSTGGTSIYSQGALVDIKHPELRFTSAGSGNANISELKIFRSDLVILKDNLTVYDLLSVKVGVLKTLTNTVFLNNSGTTALEYQTTNYSALSTVGWISGNLKRRCATGWTYDFPVGRTDVTTFPGDYMKYRHFRITFTSVAPSPCYVTVNFNTTFNPGDCNGALDNAWDLGINYVQLHPEGWWSVIPDAITSINYDAYGYIHGFTIPMLSNNKFGLLKRPDGSTSCLDWTNGGGTLNAASTSGRIHEYSGSLEIGYAQRNGLTGLSEFAIGMTNQEMLPVDLLYFYPVCNDDAVEIQWGTASETNCQQFILEKLSGDDEWKQIQVVPGAGNSNSVLHYTVKDVLPENNIPVYYRMIQTDYNGAETTYGPVALQNCESEIGTFGIVSVMQMDNQLQIVCFNPEKMIQTEVYDITGKRLYISSQNNSSGYQLISVPFHHLQNQILMIRLFNGKDVINKKHCLY